MSSSFLTMFWTIYGIVMGFMLLLGIGFYVLSSLGFYAMAKRRGIPHPGLAWLPIGGQAWIIGSLADQYAYLAEGKTKRQRGLLLGLDIGTSAVSLCFLVLLIVAIVKGLTPELMYDELAFAPFIMGFLVLYFLLLAMAIVYAVFYYIALYKVYKSCTPKNATLYLVLSIVVSVTQPFFVFFSRNKDEGMPSPQPPAGEEPTQITAPDPAAQ